MESMFREDDPLAQQLVSEYRESWRTLTPDLRDRLRAGVDEVSADDVRQLIAAPHPLVTLYYWLNKPEDAAWNLAPTFADWSSREAPTESELN